jgi:hypothetical protein
MRTYLGTVDPPPDTTDDIITSDEWFLPVPYAQQIFSLVPAAAGVVSGLLLASKFSSNRVTHVKASEVLIASGLSFAASFAVVFMIRTFQSYENVPPG